MNKHIALMTWHHTENYGTAYQAYALTRLIESCGCTVDLIDYRRLGRGPIQRRSAINYILEGLCKKSIKRKKKAQLYKFQKETFDEFWVKNFSYTDSCYYNQDFRQLNTLYDGFVCGSDQIWGPEWFDARFFLDFVDDASKLIAYSPSIGVSAIEDNNVQKEMAKLVCRFPHLSLREETGCKVIREMTGRSDVLNTLDPVLTLPIIEWNGIEERVDNLPQKYFFIFFLKNNDKNIKLSIDAATVRGCVPLVLHCTQSEDTLYANIGDLTPGQLLFCLKNADYVCTDSFHMTVLSIIYEKNFKVFKKNAVDDKTSKNNRITDLLKRLEIVEGEYDENDSFDNEIDYTRVNPILETLRQNSISFLKNAIESLPASEEKTDEQPACEQKAIAGGYCNGEQTAEFKEWGKTSKKSYNRMAQYPFALKEKCYRCKYYKGKVTLGDNRKPLFWSDLNNDFKNKKSGFHIFTKYYLAYHVSALLQKIK